MSTVYTPAVKLEATDTSPNIEKKTMIILCFGIYCLLLHVNVSFQIFQVFA